MDSFQTKENKLRQKHKEFKDKFTETRHDIQKQLVSGDVITVTMTTSSIGKFHRGENAILRNG